MPWKPQCLIFLEKNSKQQFKSDPKMPIKLRRKWLGTFFETVFSPLYTVICSTEWPFLHHKSCTADMYWYIYIYNTLFSSVSALVWWQGLALPCRFPFLSLFFFSPLSFLRLLSFPCSLPIPLQTVHLFWSCLIFFLLLFLMFQLFSCSFTYSCCCRFANLWVAIQRLFFSLMLNVCVFLLLLLCSCWFVLLFLC